MEVLQVNLPCAAHHMQRPVPQLICVVGLRASRQERAHELDPLVCARACPQVLAEDGTAKMLGFCRYGEDIAATTCSV